MLGDDVAFAIDDKRGGDAFGHAVVLRNVIVRQHEGIIDLVLFRKIGDDRRAALVDRDADDDQPLLAILVLQRDEVRNFRAARRAPRGPEIDHDDLAFEIG
jgi:hypothetical protein